MTTNDTYTEATRPPIPAGVADLQRRSGYRGLLGGDDHAIAEDMALAVETVQTIVNATGNDPRTFAVLVDDRVGMAATQLDTAKVVITGAALNDPLLTPEYRMAVSVAQGLHESGHVRLTRPMSLAVRRQWPDHHHLAEQAHSISNVLEDHRLETRANDRWSGYAGIFDIGAWWLLERATHQAGKVRPRYPFPVNRETGFSFAIAAVRYAAFVEWDDADPAVMAERAWWQQWADTYIATDRPVDHVRGVQAAFDRLDTYGTTSTSQSGDNADEAGQSGEQAEGEQGGKGQPGKGQPGDSPAQSDPFAEGAQGGGKGAQADDEDAQSDDDTEDGDGAAEGDTDEDADDEADEDEDADEGDDTEDGDDTRDESEGADEGYTFGGVQDGPEGTASKPEGGDGPQGYVQTRDMTGAQGGAEAEADAWDPETPLPMHAAEVATADDRNRSFEAQRAVNSRAEAAIQTRETIEVSFDGERGRVTVMEPRTPAHQAKRVATDPASIGALRAAFASRKTSHDSRMVSRSGRMSGARLSRVAAGYDNVFTRREALSPDRLDVHLLVDASGSMAGSGVEYATKVAANLCEALLSLGTARVHVWAHNTLGGQDLYDVWDSTSGQSMDRLSLIRAGASNNDASSIAALGQIILRDRKSRERSIMVVLSDGAPCQPEEWVRDAVEKVRADGIGVMSVAIEGGLTETQEQCYGPTDVVTWQGDWDRLGDDLAKVLGSLA